MQGHCLCGAVKWSADGPVNWAGYCHCESCRRNCAAPVTAFFGVPHGAWRWTGAVPATFRSSASATRYFCGTCGTPIAYENTRWPDEIHFYAAGLEDPQDFAPTQHFHYGERLKWLHLEDDLIKHEGSSDGDLSDG